MPNPICRRGAEATQQAGLQAFCSLITLVDLVGHCQLPMTHTSQMGAVHKKLSPEEQ